MPSVPSGQSAKAAFEVLPWNFTGGMRSNSKSCAVVPLESKKVNQEKVNQEKVNQDKVSQEKGQPGEDQPGETLYSPEYKCYHWC